MLPSWTYAARRVLKRRLTARNLLKPQRAELPQVKGLKVCRQADGRWVREFKRSENASGEPVFWLTGAFESAKPIHPDNDMLALDSGYASLVPLQDRRYGLRLHGHLKQLDPLIFNLNFQFMKYYLIAGEASGDLHASNLMAALKENDPKAEFRFLGGDLMRAVGGTLVKHYREMAFMGFIPVLLNLRTILNNMKTCQEDIRRYQPDVVILIDYPGFNLKIAKYVKTQLGLPVYYYISPKIWAWKQYRIRDFRRYVDRMFCILPFETEFFRKLNYSVDT